MATPTDVPTVMSRSRADPRRTAATIPAGRPMASATVRAPRVSDRVAGMRLPMAPITVRLENSEVPKSPCSAPLTQLQYCSSTGLSRPSRWRVSSICSAVAVSPPASVYAGSPGTRNVSRKTISDTMNSTGMALSRRRPTSWTMDPRGGCGRADGAGAERGRTAPCPVRARDRRGQPAAIPTPRNSCLPPR
jgi:hypothetical protein